MQWPHKSRARNVPVRVVPNDQPRALTQPLGPLQKPGGGGMQVVSSGRGKRGGGGYFNHIRHGPESHQPDQHLLKHLYLNLP